MVRALETWKHLVSLQDYLWKTCRMDQDEVLRVVERRSQAEGKTIARVVADLLGPSGRE